MLMKLRWPYVDLATPLRELRHSLSYVRKVRKTWQGRRALATMDARMLADIGFSRADAQIEINRKPWDIAPLSGHADSAQAGAQCRENIRQR